jgi:malonate transporter and related proteins
VISGVTAAVASKLFAVLVTVALGWIAGRMRWLGSGAEASDPARVLSNAAFYIFIPALLFRTTARLDFATLPGPIVLAYFLPVAAWLVGTYLWHRRNDGGASPGVRAITVTFGNTVQLGIPLAGAVFGEQGMALHIALTSIHALILLSIATALVERDLSQGAAWHAQLMVTLRNTVIHPVVLPVIAGLAWNLTGWGLHPVIDDVLALVGSAVVPLCLVLIGISLAYHGVAGRWREAFVFSAAKLLVLPVLVLVVARWGFGIQGMPLAVIVVMAALPVGSNPLILAQRYRVLEGEVTAGIVVSTVAFVATLALWLALLGAMPQ